MQIRRQRGIEEVSSNLENSMMKPEFREEYKEGDELGNYARIRSSSNYDPLKSVK